MHESLSYLSVPQAAKLSGYSTERIRQFCVSGKIRAEKVGNSWLIPDEAFKRFLNPVRELENGKNFSLSKASEFSGYSPERLRQFIIEGKLNAEKVGNSWVIPGDVLRKFIDPDFTPVVVQAASISQPILPIKKKLSKVKLSLALASTGLALFSMVAVTYLYETNNQIKGSVKGLIISFMNQQEDSNENNLSKTNSADDQQNNLNDTLAEILDKIDTLSKNSQQQNITYNFVKQEKTVYSPEVKTKQPESLAQNETKQIDLLNNDKESGQVLGAATFDFVSAFREAIAQGMPDDIMATFRGPKGENGNITYVTGPTQYSFGQTAPAAQNPGTVGGVTYFGAKDVTTETLTVTKRLSINATANSEFLGSLSVGENLTVADDISIGGNSTLTGTSSVGGTLTSNGQLLANFGPTLAHAFMPDWPTGTSNADNASIYINPTTATADSNLLAAAVNSVPKFIVDAEGDLFASSVTITGAINSNSLDLSGDLNVDGNTTLGDAAADTLTIRGTTVNLATDTVVDTAGGTLSINTTTNRPITLGSGLLTLPGNFTQTGATTFSTGTGAVSINGATTITGANTFSTGTGVVSLNGATTITGTNTFSTGTGAVSLNGVTTSYSQFINTKAPTLAHAFTAYPVGTSNVSDSSIYINPATAVADSNLLGAAVNGTVKFLVDAEGDIYGNNLILAGSVSQGETVIAGNLTVQDSTFLGDSSSDILTIRGTAVSIPNNLNFDSATLFIDSTNNNVGIGTTTPGTALDVVGTIQGSNGLTITSGTISLPNGQIDNAELANSSLTVTAGNGLTTGGSVSLGSSVTLNIGAGTCITVNADDVAVTADCIGDTQLAYNTGQHLTTTSAPTFATIDTGQGANELYDMDQNVLTTSTPSFAGLTLTGSLNFSGVSSDITTSGVEHLALMPGGNVGIGTTTPGTPLDVVGTIRGSNGLTISSGTISLPNGQIDNAELANSTISGIALGSNLATLTFGTYLTGTSYDGSTGVTIATNATSANTISTIVARDASGNFSAGTITASLTGNVSGSAASFTGSLSGDVTGTQGATVVGDDSHAHTGSTISGLTNSNLSGSAGITNANLANSSLTYTAGTGLTGGGTVSLGSSATLNIGAGTCMTINADDIAVTGDCIGDTQLAYNTGQHLTTTSAPTFSTIDTG